MGLVGLPMGIPGSGGGGGGGGVDLSLYGPGAPGDWVPYMSAGSWNKLIPATPSIASNSAAIIAKITGWGTPRDVPVAVGSSSHVPLPDDFDHPIYFAKPTDPLYTIAATSDAYAGWSAIQGTQIRIPNGALGASGSDSHLSVVDLTNGYVHDFYHFMYTDVTAPVHQAPSGGGTIVAKAASKYSLSGSGWLSSDPASVGIAVDAAGGSIAAGNIRPEEVTAGAINHALRMVVHSTTGSHVAPANNNAGSTDPTNAPPCGARIQLNLTDAAINAMSCSAWNKTLYKAMAHYGMYVTDTGSASWNVQAESDVGWVAMSVTSAWRTLAASLGIFHDATNDYYLWQVQDPTQAPSWSTALRVLDWTDSANY